MLFSKMADGAILNFEKYHASTFGNVENSYSDFLQNFDLIA